MATLFLTLERQPQNQLQLNGVVRYRLTSRWSKVTHGAEKLPYYTADFHMEYAMACRQRVHAHKKEEAHALW